MATRKINKYKRHTKKFRKHRGGAKSAAATAMRAAMKSGTGAVVQSNAKHISGFGTSTSTALSNAKPILPSVHSQKPPPPFKPPSVSKAFAASAASNQRKAALALAAGAASGKTLRPAPLPPLPPSMTAQVAPGERAPPKPPRTGPGYKALVAALARNNAAPANLEGHMV